MIVSVSVGQKSERIVLRCVEAFNARDLEGILACLAEDVRFHPLRLGGVRGCYRGHDGVREWFASLKRWPYDHQIAVADTRVVGGGQVLLRGSLCLDEQADVGSFCAVHRIRDGLIVAAHQYLSDADMIERLGLIP